MVGPGGAPAPARTPAQANSSQHGCRVPPQCAKLVENTCAMAMLRLSRVPVGIGQVEAGEMEMGLCPGAPSCPHSSQTLHC